jgi:hypothetical protein
MIIQPFEEKHIEEAAKLFQNSFINLQTEFPYLPGSFENINFTMTHLKEITNDNPGFVAVKSRQLVGYIVGYSSIKNFKGSQNGAYVPEWGNATIKEEKGFIYDKLYQAISRTWVARKNYTHAISFLTNRRTIDVFSLLGFGMQLIDATKDINPLNVTMTPEFNIEIATEKHTDELRELTNLINEHLISPPVFLKRNGGKLNDQEIKDMFLSDNIISMVAMKNDRIISCIRGQMNQGNIPIIDEKGTFGIDFGFTRKEYRRKKIAAMVLHELVTVAINNGAKLCSVDFETQNIEGRNFWLTYFSPIVYSMMRKIDDRI